MCTSSVKMCVTLNSETDIWTTKTMYKYKNKKGQSVLILGSRKNAGDWTRFAAFLCVQNKNKDWIPL